MYGLRGFGDVLNPTAGTALDCGLFAGGVFQKACWCLQWPSLCSQSDYVAAQALAHPETYNTLQSPPVVSAPAGSAPPSSGPESQATIDELLAQQMTDWQAQNLASMQQTQANLDVYAKQYREVTSGTNWWLIGALAAGGLVLGMVVSR